MLKKNDVINVKIEDVGSNGEGIAKVDGYILFIKNAITGDEAEVKIMKTNKKFGYARLEKIIKPSSDRVEPPCPIASRCGGCQLLHMNYDSQLKFKENLVFNNLKRIGKLEEFDFRPIIGMNREQNESNEIFRYRNKTQFPVGKNKEGKIVTGFFAERSHNIIETSDCSVTPEINNILLGDIKKFMVDEGISPYDEKEHRGMLRHILIRNGFNTKEILICLVINGKTISNLEKIVDKLKNTIADYNKEKNNSWNLVGLCLNINREKTNVIMGRKIVDVYGQNYLTDTIGDLKFKVSPLSFYQVNPEQTEKIYAKALEYAGLTGNETVWDLYCGAGTISLFLAGKAKKVFGVEIVPEAIEDANNNAKLNGIENAEFIAGAAEEVIPAYYKDTNERPDVIVVDPPRKGCDEKLLQTIAETKTDRIVYVSCDSATLARDLKYLSENGYKVVEAIPVDNFPGTVHVETVCLLHRRNI